MVTVINEEKLEIDDEIVELVKVFNKIGLTTTFSCQGHRYGDILYILFDEKITDKNIIEFLFKIYPKDRKVSPRYGAFYKWCRILGDTAMFNWKFMLEVKYCKQRYEVANEFCNIIKEAYNI